MIAVVKHIRRQDISVPPLREMHSEREKKEALRKEGQSTGERGRTDRSH